MATLDKKKELPSGSQPGGIAVDSFGKATVDPSENVKALNEASVKRLDDISELRAKYTDQIAKIRDKHYKELAEKESSRLDSIRQVDVLNQQQQAKSALDAIQALATTTTVNADNIRNALNATTAANAKQVTDLATSIAASTAASFDAMATRIAALEKANSEGVGKGSVKDPQLEDLINRVDALAAARNVQVGSDPAIADTLQTILKTQSATATEIESLRNTRSEQTGSKTQTSTIVAFVTGGLGIAISVVLLILRVMGK